MLFYTLDISPPGRYTFSRGRRNRNLRPKRDIMADSLKRFKVFIASPRDVLEERQIVREVCEELNRDPLFNKDSYLLARGWEDVFPQAGRPQAIINKLVRDCDLFVCVMHKRFGTPTKKAESGTLEEFLLAYRLWKNRRKPQIMFYFKEVFIRSGKDLKDSQLAKVLKLKDDIEANERILCGNFKEADDFRPKLLDDIKKWISESVERGRAERKKTRIRTSATRPAKSSLPEIEDYKIFALNEHRHLVYKGFETTFRTPLEIDRVYIPLKSNVHYCDRAKMTDEVRTGAGRKESGWDSTSFLDIKDVFRLARTHHLKDMAILGDPGSGKTTLLKYILVSILKRNAPTEFGLPVGTIPFYAPLRKLRDNDPGQVDLFSFLVSAGECGHVGLNEKILAKVFRSKQALVLLDGLDEVADREARIRTCRWIDGIRRKFIHTPFIVTSRFTGYTEESRLEGNCLEVSLQDFTPDDVKTFLVRWFETVEGMKQPGSRAAHKGRAEGSALAADIDRSPTLKKLAVNPLLLQVIALIRHDRGTALPQRRVEILQECVNVLLEKWDAAKDLKAPLSAREARQVLQPLALWLHEVEERRSAGLDDIAAVIKTPLETMGKTGLDPKELLINIRDRSGIFWGLSESEFGFAHHSLQEYLAAEEARNKNRIDLLVEHYSDRWWRETILLALALDNPSIIEPFLEKAVRTESFRKDIGLILDAVSDSLVKPVKPFVSAIADEKLDMQLSLNALRALRQIGTSGGPDVEKALKSVVRHRKGELARAAYDTLESLGLAEGIEQPSIPAAPALRIKTKDDAEMVLVPAGDFLFGSREDDKEAQSDEKPQRLIHLPDFYMDIYPVTNERYCRFLNDARPKQKQLMKWIGIGGEFLGEKCRIALKRTVWQIEKGYESHPVIYVSWHGAAAYAEWAGKRLPSEKEWEKTARGPQGLNYPWGDRFDKSKCNSSESGIGHTTKVTEYPLGGSPYGSFDMAGNAWEWTSSKYKKESPYYVLRGGSWYDTRSSCRCAYRVNDHPGGRYFNVGFRCARSSG